MSASNQLLLANPSINGFPFTIRQSILQMPPAHFRRANATFVSCGYDDLVGSGQGLQLSLAEDEVHAHLYAWITNPRRMVGIDIGAVGDQLAGASMDFQQGLVAFR
ncbi:hypothetical protein UM91_05490 [Pseudomonas oryzihabitans]|nr:hypothetical protein UM91_05490 [Pseudomonas oryzihabitans]